MKVKGTQKGGWFPPIIILFSCLHFLIFADPTISEPGKADLSDGAIPIQHLPNYPVSLPDTTQISQSPVHVTKCPK